MEEVTIKHWIETPVRYQNEFAIRGLEECKLDHSLFALPGPSQSHIKNNQLTKGEASEARKGNGNESKSYFQVLLDVVQFCPEDIIIQIFEGWLLIKAQHGPRMDEHGFISRSFTRQYKLPDGLQAKDLSAFFCHDGILIVEAKGLA
uniref:Heat shock protein family B (small) member 3 n=2 Tax=Latimeria chalumnae TaxID=7897 RepID=H3ARS5_LATCH